MNATTASLFRLGYHLSRAELAKRNATSFAGIFWTFITPVLTILTIWVALDQGLGMRASAGAGYGQALVAGLCAWLFVSDSILTGAHSIAGNPHFVKKVRFPVGLLPASCVFAALAIHLVILLVVIAILAFQGVTPGWQLMTLPVWIALAVLVSLAFAMLTAALTVVIPDIGAILPSIIGLLFWLTPIVWPLSMVPEQNRWIALINPFAIVVEGYRFALIGAPMQMDAAMLGLSALFAALALFLAMAFFKRVRPLFADML